MYLQNVYTRFRIVSVTNNLLSHENTGIKVAWRTTDGFYLLKDERTKWPIMTDYNWVNYICQYFVIKEKNVIYKYIHLD